MIILIMLILIYTPPMGRVPRIIWTYWDGEDHGDIVKQCRKTWYKTGYQVRVINRSNIKKWIPDVDILNLKCIDSPARTSDFVRLFLLYRYGGVWCDASLILTEDFSWLEKKFKNPDIQLFAFYSDNAEDLLNESWFLAAPQYSPLVKMWLDEFLTACDYQSLDDYIKDCIENHKITFEKFDFEFIKYLTVYLCLKKLLVKNGTKHFSNEYHEQIHFYKSIDVYRDTKVPKKILKLRKDDRNTLANDQKLQRYIFG